MNLNTQGQKRCNSFLRGMRRHFTSTAAVKTHEPKSYTMIDGTRIPNPKYLETVSLVEMDTTFTPNQPVAHPLVPNKS